jgi:hypothetical protein
MGEPTSGSFSLPAGSEIEREFQQAYGACVDAGAAVHLTERHTALGPVVIDVDLRHAGSERVYTREHVKGFLDALVSVLVDYVSVPTVEVVLLEKAGPRLCDKPGGGYKDGWHIVLPNVVTHAAVQHAVRSEFLQSPRCVEQLAAIPGVTTGASEMYDDAVIERNGWLLYGSKKPGEQSSWAVTAWWRFDVGAGRVVESDEWRGQLASQLAPMLSIRRGEGCEAVAYTSEGARAARAAACVAFRARERPAGASGVRRLDDAEFACVAALVGKLGRARSDSRNEWMRVGWCLFNLEPSDRALKLWDEFSRLSSKHRDGECEREWSRIRERGEGERRLGMPKLHEWAERDGAASALVVSSAAQRAAALKLVTRFMGDCVCVLDAVDVSADRQVVTMQLAELHPAVRAAGGRTHETEAVGVRGAEHTMQLNTVTLGVTVDGEARGFLMDEPVPLAPGSSAALSAVDVDLDSRMNGTWCVQRNSVDMAHFSTTGPPMRAEIELMHPEGIRTGDASAKLSIPDLRKKTMIRSQRSVGVLCDAYSSTVRHLLVQLGLDALAASESDVCGAQSDGAQCGRASACRSDYDFLPLLEECGFARDVVATSESEYYVFNAGLGLWQRGTLGNASGLLREMVASGAVRGLEPAEAAYIKRCEGANRVVRSIYHKLLDRDFAARLDEGVPRNCVPFDNGMLDAVHGLRPFVREDYLSGTIGYRYEPAVAEEDRAFVDAFYEQVMPDANEREYFQRMAGSALFGSGRQKHFLVLCDERDGSNAKTTLMRSVEGVHGAYAASTERTFLHVSSQSNPNGHAANLLGYRGKRLAFFDEPDKSAKLDVRRIKDLSSGKSRQSGRECGGSSVESFTWRALIVLACNEANFPEMDASDKPFLKRMKALRMRSIFVDPAELRQGLYRGEPHVFEMRGDDFVDRLYGCRSAHLQVLLEAYRRYLAEDGLGAEPPAVQDVVKTIVESADPRIPDVVEWLERSVELSDPARCDGRRVQAQVPARDGDAAREQPEGRFMTEKVLMARFWEERGAQLRKEKQKKSDYKLVLRRAMEIKGRKLVRVRHDEDGKNTDVLGYLGAAFFGSDAGAEPEL